MKPVLLRLRYSERGAHVWCRLFTAATDTATWALCGTLVFALDEWPSVRAQLEDVAEILEDE